MLIEQVIDGILKREGGYVNNPADPGGPTKYGITEKTARRHGWTGPIQDLTEDFARQVYRGEYWTEPGFDKVATLDGVLAEELCDTGVNMGVKVAATFFQRALNALNLRGEMFPDVPVDGLLGPKTINGFASFLTKRGPEGASVLLRALNCLQGARYIELCEAREKNEEFVYGWLRQRVNW